MMVSPKKIWYLTYPPGNSKMFKSIKVLFKRTFFMSNTQNRLLYITNGNVQILQEHQIKGLFYASESKDICATHEDILKPNGSFCPVVNNHSMNTFTPGKGRGKKTKQNKTDLRNLKRKFKKIEEKNSYIEKGKSQMSWQETEIIIIIKPCYNGWGIATMASVQYNE